MTRYEGNLLATGMRFAIVASRFNDFVVDKLRAGARDALIRHGADGDDIDEVLVPGSWEIPLACQTLAAAGKHDAVVAVGCVIRGSTPHFDYVAAEVSKGVAQTSLQHGVPVTFGVITTDTIEQAIERAGTKAGNKGFDAALAAVEMVSLLRGLRGA